MTNATIYIADALDTLRTLPDEHVQCCVTSPPYWGLRDYGEDDQLGLEPTPDEYVQNMVRVFREVRRVLRPDGTLWLNLGDSYAGSWGNYGDAGGGQREKKTERFDRRAYNDKEDWRPPTSNPPGLKPKDQCLIPHRVAMALQNDGWWLRSTIIWAKGNPMPESVTDRPTSSHEYVFLLSKSKRYFYDADAVREESETPAGYTRLFRDGDEGTKRRDNGRSYTGNGTRNKRDVWHINTKPFSDAHFAVYPPELVLPCIQAGTSKKGQCAECGAPWERRVDSGGIDPSTGEEVQGGWGDGSNDENQYKGGFNSVRPATKRTTQDWQPTCKCGADPEPQTVLDPFSGAGTTGLVSLKQGRHYIGIELSEEYADMSVRRMRDECGDFFHSYSIKDPTAA